MYVHDPNLHGSGEATRGECGRGCWETFRDVMTEDLLTNPKHGGAAGELQREVF